MPPMLMKHDVDPKQEIFAKVGDLSDVIVMGAEVLMGTYIRPKITSGNLHLPDSVVDEDKWQGKVGLVLKMGPLAFEEAENAHFPQKAQVGDWIVIRASDGMGISVNKTDCRLVPDVRVKMIVQSPDIIW